MRLMYPLYEKSPTRLYIYDLCIFMYVNFNIKFTYEEYMYEEGIRGQVRI